VKTQQDYSLSQAKPSNNGAVDRFLSGELGGMPIPLVLVALAGTAMGSLLALAGGGGV
jgi:hypothetical protein